VRTIFTPEQLERLEAEFERQQYMVRLILNRRKL
jgi:Homeodomain